MDTIRTFRKVMRVEARLFSRSWLFRFLIALAVLVIGFFSWLFFVQGSTASWMLRSIPSSIPYFMFLLLTIFQGLVVIFGAIDSIQRDYRLDTFESLHVRTMSNLTYMIGKAAGIMLPCLIMSMIFLVLMLIMHVFFISSVPIDLQAYVMYFLLLNLPAVLFITGLSFVAMSVFRSKILAMHLLVAFYIVPFLYRDGIIASFFDYSALHLPFLSSSIVGLENVGSVLLHRGFFALLGLSGIMLSALMFQRLPQSFNGRKYTKLATAGCLVAAILAAGFYTGDILGGIHLREQVQALNETYAGKPRARLASCDLDIRHRGSTFDVTADLKLHNHHTTPLETLYLSLNPGFAVRSVTTGTSELAFSRDLQMLTIDLPAPLNPGDDLALKVVYDGTINDDACYPDIESSERIKPNRLITYVVNKRYGFISGDYILLTPECQWYPVSGVAHGLVFPETHERDFTDFSITINTREGLTVISQGAVETSGDGTVTVMPETKLPGLTLVVGDYEKRSVEVDGVEVALYNLKGNFYFQIPTPIKPESVITALEGIKENYEYNKKMNYPFPRYYVVESPVQFHAYERPWKTCMETMQPQMAIVPERGFFVRNMHDRSFDLEPRLEMYRRSGIDQLPPEDQLMTSIVRSNLYDIFMSDRVQRETARTLRSRKPSVINLRWFQEALAYHYLPGYTMSVQYYPFITSFESERYPVFNTIMEFYRKHGLNTNTNVANRMSKPLYDEEIACMALEEDSFENYLAKGTDFDTMNLLLMLKSNHLFGSLQALIGNAGFDAFLNEYIAEHAFENVSYEQFAFDVEERFGLNMDTIFETWFSESRLPLFVVDDVSITEVEEGEHIRYQTQFNVTNTQPVPGTMWVQLRLQGGGNMIERETRYITLDGNQTKEIGIITDSAPPDMEVNTLISQNIPIMYRMNLSTPVADSEGRLIGYKPMTELVDDGTGDSSELFEGERVIAYSPPTMQPGTVVVDNLDSGFEVISNPNNVDEGMYASLYDFDTAPNGFILPILNMPPKRWGKSVFTSAYGGKSTALYARGGDGDACVAWHANIPETGRYDLEYYIVDDGDDQGIRISPRNDGPQKPLFGEYNLTVTADGHDDAVVFMPRQDEPGWQYVSTFNLEPGQVDVCLSNKSNGMCVYADAIRWVKR